MNMEQIFQLFLQLDQWKLGAKAGDKSKWAMKGVLTWQDLKGLASDLGEQIDDDMLKEMCTLLDADEDGVLGPDDFYNAINHAQVAIDEEKRRLEALAIEEATTPGVSRQTSRVPRSNSF